MKGKLLEAAAYGKVIISTKHGIEGTEFLPEQHVLYGETDKEFAQKCIEAIQKSKKASVIAYNAKMLFKSKYEWRQIGREYNAYLTLKALG